MSVSRHGVITMSEKREPIDDLADDEVGSWMIGDTPYVHCYDIPARVGCCFECHDAERQGRANLSAIESLGRKEVKTWLCCVPALLARFGHR
jgi:hypothetical protein